MCSTLEDCMTTSHLTELLSAYRMPRATDPIALRVAISRQSRRGALARRLELSRRRVAPRLTMSADLYDAVSCVCGGRQAAA